MSELVTRKGQTMSKGLTSLQMQHAGWVTVKFPDQELSDVLELLADRVKYMRKAYDEHERGLIDSTVFRMMLKDLVGNTALHLMSCCDAHDGCFENVVAETWRLLKKYNPTSRVNIL